MSDNDQTILSSSGAAGVTGAPGSPQGEQKPKRNPLVIIGGIGCALLLCAGLMLGGGLYMASDQLEELAAGLSGEASSPTPAAVADTPAPEPSPTVAAAAAGSETEATATVEAEPEATATTPPTATVPAEPVIGSITFARDATEEFDPIEPGTEFEGDITEIHAIFEYSGFSGDNTWERVWYLDGEEMLRSAEPWSGENEGVFDYFINAGGQPLSPGEWTLELYVDNLLLATDSFTIASDEPAIAQATSTRAATATSQASAATPTPADDASPTPRPQPVARTYPLAFTKWDGGKHLLFVGDTSGGQEKYILGRAAGPSWTPSGDSIFFYGEEGIDRQDLSDGRQFVFDGVSNGIVSINMSPIPANIEQVRLFQGNDWKSGSARWANVSPDGQMVAFDARPGGDYRIYFLGTNDNQQFRFELLGEQGDWSPDSQKIVYRSGRDGKTGIWISNRDDSGHTPITSNGNDAFPAWSPDGRTIVFHREEGGNVDLYAMNADGSNVRRLTDAPGPDTLPTFTPAGEIIFRSARSGSWGIWKMNADGSNQQQIYADANVGPDWSYSRMDVLQ